MTEFSALVGVTLTEIIGDNSSDEIVFVAGDGARYIQYHSQDCCEYVRVEEIVGDLEDLVGEPILLAEEVSYDNEPTPDGATGSEDYCWTFYKLATVKGHVTIRWLGESNGYYSTSVDFRKD